MDQSIAFNNIDTTQLQWLYGMSLGIKDEYVVKRQNIRG